MSSRDSIVQRNMDAMMSKLNALQIGSARPMPDKVDDDNIKLSKTFKDSKKLNQDQRTRLYNEIIKDCISYSIMSIDSKKIDKINILNSTYLAMNFAIENLEIKPHKIIIDGNRFKTDKKINFECIVGGDNKYLSIAAASILAKVKRDEIMCDLNNLFPVYDWKNNKGYGTISHIEMISKYGLCRFHRKTFKIKNKQLKLTI